MSTDQDSTKFLPPQAATQTEYQAVEQPGATLGRYKLLEKIGEGGFGVVYVAEQKEPVRRRVALKIIKLGMDTRSVVARFEAERQALAMMDHPNIAKVFDAGATDTGRPYFVMELVRGIPITHYCDQSNLAPQQRLSLFIDVCQAIQHAHQKGVIHRDIKPSNILVTLNDGTPIPKVIDFGIAKATQGDLTDKTVYTQLQQFIGTPAYMSPEQAEMSALDVDTRSDIYSLGVLLYELLTGTTPFDGAELLKAGMDQMRRTIRETDPVRPSNRLSGMTGDDSTKTAKRRGMEARRLVTLLRGDLDWIVMKCLEKDRTRRYETANGLGVDIKRYLNNEPITARPPSSAYRFQKLVRRNKLVFGAAATVLLVLVLGITVSIWQAVRATRAQERESEQRQIAETNEKEARDAQAGEAAARATAEHERATAEAQAARSAQVAQAMKDMLGHVGPNVSKGMDTKLLVAILDQTAAGLGTSLKGQPAVEADLRQIMGKVYADLDDRPHAEAMFGEALRLRKEALGEEAPAVAEAMNDYATALDYQDKHTEALAMARAALAMNRKLLGDENLAVANSLYTLGAILRRYSNGTTEQNRETEKVLREALAMQRKLSAKPVDTALTLTALGMVLGANGKADESIACHREALQLRRQTFGENDPSVANSLIHVGVELMRQDKLPEAEAMMQQAVALLAKLESPEHRDLLLARDDLADLLLREGKLPEAEAELRRSVDGWIKRGGSDRNALSSINRLGQTLEQEGKLAEAEALYRQTSRTANLIRVLEQEGKTDEARKLQEAGGAK